MTSALRGREGGWSKCDDSTDRLREWDSDKGGGGPKNPKSLRTSFNYRPLWAGQLLGSATLPSPGDHIGNESEGRLQ